MNQYTNEQIRNILKRGESNAGRAVVKDGKIFIHDIVILGTSPYQTLSLTVCGQPVDLRHNADMRDRVQSIVRKTSDINIRRNKIRAFLQKLSDKITQNNHLNTLSEAEIVAWFALDKMNKNLKKLAVKQINFMYEISLGDIKLCHLPAEAAGRLFLVVIGDAVVEIKNTSNAHLYERAESLFFNIFDDFRKSTEHSAPQKTR